MTTKITFFILLLALFAGCNSQTKIIFPTEIGNFNSGWEFVGRSG